MSKRGSYRCSLEHGKHEHRRSYDISECDFIILFAPYSKDYPDLVKDGYYIVPASDIGKSTVGVLFPAGKGKGNIQICKWEKYRDGWESI